MECKTLDEVFSVYFLRVSLRHLAELYAESIVLIVHLIGVGGMF